MFTFQPYSLAKKDAERYLFFRKEKPLRYFDFIKLLQKGKNFRSFFINFLSEVPYRAYHWETPPVTKKSIHQIFDCVIYNRPQIDLPADPTPFRKYFDHTSKVAIFSNLGKDAQLIAPAPSDQPLNYSHIGTFSRQAPKEQQQTFWKTVGEATERRISTEPLWLNTAGGGVSWLHIRLDSTPKYYLHEPYKVIS